VFFFSLSDTKLVSYILPAFPALALLLGEALGGFTRRAEEDFSADDPRFVETGWRSGWRVSMGVLTLLFNVTLGVAAGFFLLNEKTMEQGQGTIYLVIVGVVLLANL